MIGKDVSCFIQELDRIEEADKPARFVKVCGFCAALIKNLRQCRTPKALLTIGNINYGQACDKTCLTIIGANAAGDVNIWKYRSRKD